MNSLKGDWKLFSLAVMCWAVGCAGMSAGKEQAPVKTEIVRQDEEMMSPAQRAERYREAFSEGVKLVRRAQYGPALAAFEEAVRLKPDSQDALFNLAACYEAVGDPLRAINIYKAVVAQNPSDPDCYTNLGTSYIKMYHREKTPSWRDMALEAWRRSLTLKPDQPHVQRFIASARMDN